MKASADDAPPGGRRDDGWDETVLVWNGVVARIRRASAGSAAAANELAVASDAVGAIGVDEIAPGTASDRVASAVNGPHDIAAGPRE
jgi:hypothetical protein